MIYINSELYGIQSKKKLCSLLGIPHGKLYSQEDISAKISPYIDNTNNSKRLIEAPNDELKKIQAKIKKILLLLPVDDYIFSGVKGRSYPDNAAMHSGNFFVHKIDLVSFFPKTSREKVFLFFKNSFKVSSDVAEILTNFTTVNLDLTNSKESTAIDSFLKERKIKTRNHLISGSPSSQILSYFANKPMFDEIQEYCAKNSIRFSIYVDDLTFSSENVFQYKFKTDITRIIKRHCHRISSKKTKTYTRNYRKEITGVIITSDGKLVLTNSLRLKIKESFDIVKSDPENEKEWLRLRGLVTAARQVVPNAFPHIWSTLKEQSMIFKNNLQTINYQDTFLSL